MIQTTLMEMFYLAGICFVAGMVCGIVGTVMTFLNKDK